MYSESEESKEELREKHHYDIIPLPYYSRSNANKETENMLVKNEDIEIKVEEINKFEYKLEYKYRHRFEEYHFDNFEQELFNDETKLLEENDDEKDSSDQDDEIKSETDRSYISPNYSHSNYYDLNRVILRNQRNKEKIKTKEEQQISYELTENKINCDENLLYGLQILFNIKKLENNENRKLTSKFRISER